MKKPSGKKIRTRRSWTINPKTRVCKNGRVYKRRKTRMETAKVLYEG